MSVKFDDRHPPYFANFATIQELYVHGAATAKPAGADATPAGDFLALFVDEDEGKFGQSLHFLMQLRNVNHGTKYPAGAGQERTKNGYLMSSRFKEYKGTALFFVLTFRIVPTGDNGD